jgi:hypothetical protein
VELAEFRAIEEAAVRERVAAEATRNGAVSQLAAARAALDVRLGIAPASMRPQPLRGVDAFGVAVAPLHASVPERHPALVVEPAWEDDDDPVR